MDILALDLATRTGWARGIIGAGAPQSGTVQFGNSEASNNAVFAHALSWLSTKLEPKPRPDIVIVEAMLPPTAKVGHTSADSRDRLAGLHGIVRAVTYLRGIYEIHEAGVSTVRAHFIGASNLKRDEAKRQVMHRCRELGWAIDDHNAADALALWSFCASTIDPEFGISISPLFHGRTVRISA
jgi:hypothetical protein